MEYVVRDYNDEGGHAIWLEDPDGDDEFFCQISCPYSGQKICNALNKLERVKEMLHGEDAGGIVLDIADLLGEDISA